MDFKKYLENLPMLHTWDGGKTWNSGGFQPEHLSKLYDFLKLNLPGDAHILETGAGNSTITFLSTKPSKLITIAPEEKLFERIKQFCVNSQLDIGPLEIYVNGSEWVLPILATKNQEAPNIDFVLLDGCHNWPIAFIDFFYCNFMLKAGGYIMIDDIQLHSVKELAKMLMEQPGYEMVLDMGKSVIFQRMTEDRTLGEWIDIPYIVRRTEEYSRSSNPFRL